MTPAALSIAHACKGFLDNDEGLRLFELGREAASIGTVVEIGSYCGKSSIYLGSGVRDGGGVLVCVDHHRGSEEHQVGEGYHDPDLFDPEAGLLDTLGELRRNLGKAELESSTVLLVTSSRQAASVMSNDLGMVFIDGGHSHEAAHTDFEVWSPKIAPGGILAIHDLFPNPDEGGQAPIEIYRRALSEGLFEELATTKTLGVLRRRS